jgi:hypothetical protein
MGVFHQGLLWVHGSICRVLAPPMHLMEEVLKPGQKLTKVHNLLRQLADAGLIQNVGGAALAQMGLGQSKTRRDQSTKPIEVRLIAPCKHHIPLIFKDFSIGYLMPVAEKTIQTINEK